MDEHNIVFQEGINVLFCMTPQERVATKFSQYDELQLKDNTKSELLGNTKISGVGISLVKEDRVGELQDVAHKKSVFITNRIRK